MHRTIWIALLLAPAAIAAPTARPLLFEENLGQVDGDASHVLRTRQASYLFEARRVTARVRGGGTVHWSFPGREQAAKWSGDSPSSVRVDSYTGGRSRWRQGIGTYERLRMRSLYSGIDAVAYWNGDSLEFDFVVHPNADAGALRLRFDGGKARVDSRGEIVVRTPGGEIRHRRPIAYQMDASGRRVSVASRFQPVRGGEIALRVGAYDHARELIIDPIVEGIMYAGGSQDDDLFAMSGRFVCGTTASVDSPMADAPARGVDLFVYGGLGGRFVYIGGSGDETPTAFTATSTHAVIGGRTNSRDFPTGVSERPYPTLHPDAAVRAEFRGGDTDNFLVLIPLFGSSLPHPMVSTYWGEPEAAITALAVEENYPEYMHTVVAVEKADGPNGGRDVTLIGLDELLRPMVRMDWGGSGDDRVSRMTFLGPRLVAAGKTTSRNLGTETQDRERGDAFVAIFDSRSLEPRGAVTIGGSGEEDVRALAANVEAIWIGGRTSSEDLTAIGAWQSRYGGGAGDGFAAVLDAETLRPVRISYSGGSGDDAITGIVLSIGPGGPVALGGTALLAGTTSSTDLPVTSNAEQAQYGGGASDGFYLLVRKESDPATVSYLGGAGDDVVGGAGMSLSPMSIGGTTTAELGIGKVIHRMYRGGREVFLARVNLPDGYGSPVVAKGLVVNFDLPAAEGMLGGMTQVRSADPQRLMLSSPFDMRTQAALSVAPKSMITLWGLADSGTVDLIVGNPGVPEMRIPVRMVPGGFGFAPGRLQFWSLSYAVATGVQPVALDPDTKRVIALQMMPPNRQIPALSLESSDSSVLRIEDGTKVQALKAGSGLLRVLQPDGFTEPAPAAFDVVNGRIRFTCPGLGKDLRTVAQAVFEGPSLQWVTWEVEPGGPVQLTQSQSDPTLLGVMTTRYGADAWFETQSDSGTATIRVSAAGYEPATFLCPVYPSAIGFASPQQLRRGQVGTEYTEALIAGVLTPGYEIIGTQVPRPGLGAVSYRVTGSATSSNGSSPHSVSITPATVGEESLTLISSGFPVSPGRSTISLRTRPPGPLQVIAAPVGQYLTSQISLRRTSTDGSLRVTLRANGGRFQLWTANPADARDEITIIFNGQDRQVGLVAQGEVGTAVLSVHWDSGDASGDFAETVSIVPARVSWVDTPDDVFLRTSSVPVNVGISSYAIVNGVQTWQIPGPRLLDHIRVNYPADGPVQVLQVSTGTDLNAPLQCRILARRPGRVTLALEGDLGFVEATRSLRIDVQPSMPTLELPVTGVQLTAMGMIRSSGTGGAPARLRLRSGDPSRATLSLLPQTPGTEMIETTLASGESVTPFYVHGIGEGNVAVALEMDTGERSSQTLRIVPSGLVFQEPGVVDTEVSERSTTVRVQLSPLDPVQGVSLFPSFSSQLQSLRPGAAPAKFRLVADPAGVVELTPAELTIEPGNVSTMFNFRPVAPGTTVVRAIPPAGFTVPRDSDGFTIRAKARRFQLSRWGPVGQDTITYIKVTSNDDVTRAVTVSSSNPALLLVSARDRDMGTARVTFTPGTRDFSFHIHGLTSNGMADIRVESEGYQTETMQVTLVPAAVQLTGLPKVTTVGTSLSGLVTPMVQGASGDYNSATLRPGAVSKVRLSAQPSGVVELPAEVLVGQSFQGRALSAGKVTVTVTPPDGFANPEMFRTIELTVEGRALLFNQTSLSVGKDLLTTAFIRSTGTGQVAITLTSSDAALLRLSATSGALGTAVTTLPAQSGEIYLHGMAASGRATVTASAPGHASASLEVTLTPSGFMIVSPWSPRSLATGQSDRVLVQSVPLNPSTLRYAGSPQSLRPGADTSIRLVSSDPTVVRVDPPQVVIGTGNVYQQPAFTVAMLQSGHATLTLETPAGFQRPAEGQSIDYNVTDAFFVFDPPKVGHDLAVSTSVLLSPAPPAATNVTIRSLDPDRLLVSRSATEPGQEEVAIRVSARSTAEFSLHGIASSGNARLLVSAPGYREFQVDVPILPSGFVFEGAAPTLSGTSPWRTAIVLAPLSSLTGQPYYPAPDTVSLRAGAGPIALTLESSNPAVGLTFAPFNWLDGQTRVVPTVRWGSPGNTTVRIVQPPGFQESPRRAIDVTVQ